MRNNLLMALIPTIIILLVLTILLWVELGWLWGIMVPCAVVVSILMAKWVEFWEDKDYKNEFVESLDSEQEEGQ